MISKDNIKGIECRFAVHCGRPEGTEHDIHLVKEIIHTKDGKRIPNIRFLKDYKRNFWVTKKGFQNHQQKKETELKSRCDEFKSTQTDLAINVAKALGMPGARPDLRRLSSSPYLYGTDILSTADIKRNLYQKRFPDLNTPFSLACFDTEADVVRGTKETIMATLSYKDRVFTAVQKSFLVGVTDAHDRAQEMLIRYLGEYVTARNIKWELKIVDSELEVIRSCFNKAHEWRPDIVSIWNMNYDIPIIMEGLDRVGADPKDIFSDPKVPPAYRFFKYKQGPKQKKTASGKMSPIKPADQWHTVYTPASFYILDGMCVYRKIRIANGEKPSYALDAILNDELGIRKLKFKEADAYEGIDWHIFMQTNYKLEYIIYNVFDCISMELLDERTKDIQIAFPMQSGCSDFANFKSQPRRTSDELNFFVQELDPPKVYGSTSDEMTSELDSLTLPLTDWIITLPAHLVSDNGLKCIAENPNQSTNIHVHTGD